MTTKFLKDILIIVASVLIIILVLEIAARILISFKFNNSKAGLPERTRYLKYQVFTMWGKDLPAAVIEFNKEVKKNDFKIIVIGGSTAEGFNQYQSLLLTEIKKVIPSKYKEVKIFNAASGGFNIRQEAISLMLVSEQINPDLIIVIDGANDMIQALRPNVNPNKTSLDFTYDLILSYPFLAPVIYILQNSQLYNGVLRFLARNKIDNFRIESLKNAQSIYLKTRDFINNYAEGSNTPIIFLLQPFVGFSNSVDDKEAKSRYKYREKLIYDAFEKLSIKSDHLCFIDTNISLNRNNLNLRFSDDVHFIDSKGYKYITDEIIRGFKICYPNLVILK